MKALAGFVTALYLGTTGVVFADSASDVVKAARTDCAFFDDGILTVEDGAIQKADLSGDGNADEIVDMRYLSCSTAVSIFCGTGGCSLSVIVNRQSFDFLSKDWRIVPFGSDQILLLEVHGAECGGTNLRKCYEAQIWSEGGFRSVGIE